MENKRVLNFLVLALAVLLIPISLLIVASSNHLVQERAAAASAKHEVELEKIHSVGYEQGYLAAVWDGHFGSLKYQIQETEGAEPVLWKRQEIDDVSKRRLSEPENLGRLEEEQSAQQRRQ